jgi:peptidoglycan/xylan/chitin deacetylase (PgdA/CDA1 family)
LQKNELVGRLAEILGIDSAPLISKRILQLMSPQEVAEVANNGVDVQLHTHRHRTPADEASFRREIIYNRQRIRTFTGKEATHFCYPSGVYRKEFVGWLKQETVVSATTCDAGMVSRQTDPLLLPRFVDSARRTPLEFESWLSGIGHILAFRRAARQTYVPHE